MAYDTISVTPVTPNIGGLVEGIDLTQPLGEATVKDLHDALMDRLVLFFRDQELTHETQKALGAHFGTLHVSVGGDGTNSKQLSDHPEVRALHFDENSTAISGNEIWHTDQSCMETPPITFTRYRPMAAATPCSPACMPPMTPCRTA
jgi:taurine dioxygenase